VVAAYIGDGNNVAHSFMLGAAKTGMTLRVATPAGFEPLPRYRELAEQAARFDRRAHHLRAGSDRGRA